jgi:arsenate reductase
MKKILVLCTGNSCRSQMAEGYLRLYAKNQFEVYSAGVETHGLNPKAVACMLADGVDISHHTSNLIEEYKHLSFDYVLSVCDHAAERCPVFPSSAIRLHHDFDDPSKCKGTVDEIDQAFIATRNEIKTYCEQLAKRILNSEE